MSLSNQLSSLVEEWIGSFLQYAKENNYTKKETEDELEEVIRDLRKHLNEDSNRSLEE